MFTIREPSWFHNSRIKVAHFFDRILAPHPSIQEIGSRRQARLLAALSLLLAVMTTIGIFSTLSVTGSIDSAGISLSILTLVAVFVYVLSRTKYFIWGAATLSTMLVISAFVSILGGSDDPGASLNSFVILGYLFGSAFLPVWGLVVLVVTSLIGISLLPLFIAPQYSILIVSSAGTVGTIGIILIIVTAFRNSIERERLSKLISTNKELQSLQSSLEQRVSDRTKEITAASEVGRVLAQQRNLDILLPEAVNLVSERFNLYYAQIYLLDNSGRVLILRSGSGAVGSELLLRGHRLPLNFGSINSQAVSDKKPVIVSDTSKSSTFRPNPLLPLTRSEMAVPLQTSARVLGVLDLQSEIPGFLTEENLPVFETLAGQLAIAVDNATLYQESQRAQSELENQARRLTQQGWQEFMDAVDRPEQIGYTYSQGKITTFSDSESSLGEVDNLEVPILIADQPIGIVRLEGNPQETWEESDKETVRIVASQVSRQLENIRLLNQAETYRAEAEAATRRLTREAWQDFIESTPEGMGFVYDQNQVSPLKESVAPQQNALTRSLIVRGEAIGELLIAGVENLNETTSELVNIVTERLSAHLENLRLSNQTQQALAETDALLGITAELNSAQEFQDVLTAITDRTVLKEANQSLMMCLFDRPLGRGQVPEWILPVAHKLDLPIEIASRYPLNAFEKEQNTLFTNQTVVIKDIATDLRLDRITKKLFQDVFQSRSSVIVPLMLADQSLGFVMGNYGESVEFTSAEIQRLSAIAGQVAITIQGLQLLKQTQERARREQLLREVTEQINNAVSTDMVLYRAAQELGRVLKQQVFVYLGEGRTSVDGNPPQSGIVK